MEVTRVYDDWSFSSSSEKGLKEVRLFVNGTSSVSFVLLLDLEECPLSDSTPKGELGDSICQTGW